MTEQGLENVVPKELITPEGIKNRVMEFFQGADLNTDGTSEHDVRTVKTGTFPREPAKYHEAIVNGMKVAFYEHSTDLEPLAERKDRKKAEYRLTGDTGNGTISLGLTEYEGKPAEIYIEMPGNAMNQNGKRGLLEKFDTFDRKFLADVFKIKS